MNYLHKQIPENRSMEGKGNRNLKTLGNIEILRVEFSGIEVFHKVVRGSIFIAEGRSQLLKSPLLEYF